MKNRGLNLVVLYILISVLPSGAASGADHNILLRVPTGAALAGAGAGASATIINPETQSCDELRLRTRSSYYIRGSVESRDRRPIDTRCIGVEGQTAAQLVVQYRDSNGSTVTVTLDDGSVSISPHTPDSLADRGAADGVHMVDVLLNYD